MRYRTGKLEHDTLKRWRDAAKLLRQLEDDQQLDPHYALQAGMLAKLLEQGGAPRTLGLRLISGRRNLQP